MREPGARIPGTPWRPAKLAQRLTVRQSDVRIRKINIRRGRQSCRCGAWLPNYAQPSNHTCPRVVVPRRRSHD